MAERVFVGLRSFEAFLGERAAAAEPTLMAAVGVAATKVFTTAQSLFGDADKLQPALAPSTQAERARLGFTPADPLLRTGKLFSELQYEHRGLVAAVGSEDPVMLYQEVGTAKIPPRPLLRIAAKESLEANQFVFRACIAETLGMKP